jgi:molybdopterin-guanine dinucleotide biosynthesis protein A
MGKSIILFLGPGHQPFLTKNLFPTLVQEANKKMEGILEIVYEQLDEQEHLMMFYPKDVQEFNKWVNT